MEKIYSNAIIPNNQNIRIQKIILLLKNKKMVSVKQISEDLKVTKMTIYRDIEILKEKGIVKNINGVVIYEDKNSDEEFKIRNGITYDLPTESNRHIKEKNKIAEYAVNLLEDGDTIYIDSGSTMELLSRLIPENKNIVVACHAFYVLANIQMKKGCDIIFAGGYYQRDTSVFESEEAVQLLKKVRINKAFFAAGGVDADLGVTCANPYVLNIKRTVLESSLSKILLVDSSKFETLKKVYYANINEFDTIITDNGISETKIEKIKKSGIKLIIV